MQAIFYGHIDLKAPWNLSSLNSSTSDNSFKSYIIDNQHFAIRLQGCIYNLNDLNKEYDVETFEKALGLMCTTDIKTAINKLNGEFRGVYYNKQSRELSVFTDHCSLLPIFWTKRNSKLYVGHSTPKISEQLTKENEKIELSELGAHMLLAYDYQIGNSTLINGCNKVAGGTSIHFNGEIESQSTYSDFNEIPQNRNYSLNSLIEEFNNQFEQAVFKRVEFAGNREIQSTLSGGLDSRVVTFVAKNYTNKIVAICCSQSDYLDHQISKEIASDLGIDYFFEPLDRANHLFQPEKIAELNGGLTNYSAAAHFYELFASIGKNNADSTLTGIFGDGLLGSGLQNLDVKANAKAQVSFLPSAIAIQNEVDKISSNYKSQNSFLLHSRRFNFTTNGHYLAQEFVHPTSPFCDPELIRFTLSIPEKELINNKLYLKWLNTYQKETTNYLWEKYNAKPKSEFNLLVGRAKRKVLKIAKGKDSFSMCPEEYWFSTNENLQLTLINYCNNEMHRIEPYLELKNNCIELIKRNNFESISKVVTLLSAMKVQHIN
jgi:asparagine synthase (glutamine-hydrolysing)